MCWWSSPTARRWWRSPPWPSWSISTRCVACYSCWATPIICKRTPAGPWPHSFPIWPGNDLASKIQRCMCLSAKQARTDPNTPGLAGICGRPLPHGGGGGPGQGAAFQRIGNRRAHRGPGASKARPRPRKSGGRWNSAMGEARDGLAQKLDREFERRLSGRESGTCWRCCGRRWAGAGPDPGGVALRAGGMASLGLGAGAWLARRNPLLAAGAAGAALATSKLQSHGRSKAMRASGAWLPPASDFKAWHSESLAPVRMGLDRAGMHALRPAPGRRAGGAPASCRGRWPG